MNVPAVARAGDASFPERWAQVHSATPQFAVTMLAYLAQITVSMRPATVTSTETDLRTVAMFVLDYDSALSCVAVVERSHIEAFKVWQHAQPGISGTIKPATFRRRIGILRMLFIRIVEWGWHDAPDARADLLR